jgi:hypothetical protein
MRIEPMPAKGAQHKSRFFGTIIAWAIFAGLPPSATPLAAAPSPSPAVSTGDTALSYADIADLALHADIVAGVTGVKAERLKGELAPGLAPDRARFLVQAATGMLLRGANGMPGVISYIVDLPLNAGGKPPKLKKARFILIADHVADRPQEVRLTSPYSQLDWTQANESRLRAILTEATASSVPPAVTGIGNAFYVPGAVPGESESQIFLTTSDARPISLSILRRPGEQPQWGVALGDIIDENAKAPAHDSLLWYRLACFLPPRLPGRAIAALSETNASAVREDYHFVLDQLGPCGRTIEHGG